MKSIKNCKRWTSDETLSFIRMLDSKDYVDGMLALSILENNITKLPSKDRQDHLIQAIDNWVINLPFITLYNWARAGEVCPENEEIRKYRSVAEVVKRIFLGRRVGKKEIFEGLVWKDKTNKYKAKIHE